MTESGESRRLLSRALHETLEAYVTPSVRQSIVREALTRSCLSNPPSTPFEAEEFLQGALHDVVRRVLGDDTARRIVDEILRTVAPLSSDMTMGRHATPAPASRKPTPSGNGTVQPRVSTTPNARRDLTPRSERAVESAPVASRTRAISTGPALSAGAYFRNLADTAASSASSEDHETRVTVLAATTDRSLLGALAHALGDSGNVLSLRSVFALVRAVDEHAGERVFVLLDGLSPGIRPTALGALAEDLTDVPIVLCRASDETYSDLLRAFPSASGWVRLHAAQSPAAVAADCVRLVS